jgi:hypothetical protein
MQAGSGATWQRYIDAYSAPLAAAPLLRARPRVKKLSWSAA